MVILELSYNEQFGLWYAEGMSDKLPMLDGLAMNSRTWGGLLAPAKWFCFEESWVKAAMVLQKLGFTATQIVMAREKGVEDVEAG